MPPALQVQVLQRLPSSRIDDRHKWNVKLPFVFADSVAATGCTILIPGQAVVFVYAGLVVTGVTARASGLVARRRPVDHVRIVLVALGASEVAAMILRFIPKPGMPVIAR